MYIDSESLDATQIKAHIKSCDAFIGARTPLHHRGLFHAGAHHGHRLFGEESRGIAKDLFGTEEEYVIPVGDVSGDVLVRRSKRLLEKTPK